MSDKINVLISEEDVEKRIQEIGAAISKEYEGKCVCPYPAMEMTRNQAVL